MTAGASLDRLRTTASSPALDPVNTAVIALTMPATVTNF
jgi:hypothetical protein